MIHLLKKSVIKDIEYYELKNKDKVYKVSYCHGLWQFHQIVGIANHSNVCTGLEKEYFSLRKNYIIYRTTQTFI